MKYNKLCYIFQKKMASVSPDSVESFLVGFK